MSLRSQSPLIPASDVGSAGREEVFHLSMWQCVAVGAFSEVWPSSLAPRDPGPPFLQALWACLSGNQGSEPIAAPSAAVAYPLCAGTSSHLPTHHLQEAFPVFPFPQG